MLFYRENRRRVKIHASALLDPLTLPLTVMVTPGDVHDSLEFEDLIEDSKLFIDLHTVILAFDRGYWKMERFIELCEKGYRFVTLMKKGIKYEVISKIKGENYSDKIVKLLNGLELRLVQYKLEDGEIEEFLTNIFDFPAEEIKESYKSRWAIEIFFREIKSYLKIEKFIGKSLNAVLIQIFCTLIAYILIALLKYTFNLNYV